MSTFFDLISAKNNLQNQPLIQKKPLAQQQQHHQQNNLKQKHQVFNNETIMSPAPPETAQSISSSSLSSSSAAAPATAKSLSNYNVGVFGSYGGGTIVNLTGLSSSSLNPTIPFNNKDMNLNLKGSTNNLNKPLAIRLLIFLEDSDGSRSNIFDSAKYRNNSNGFNSTQISANSSQRNKPSSSSSIPMSTTLSNSVPTTIPRTTLSKAPTNSNSSKLNNEMLIKMVFGSLPMVVSNRTAIKVHSFKNSNKTMISNVFLYYNNNTNKHTSGKNGSRFGCTCQNAKHHEQEISRRESLNTPNNNITQLSSQATTAATTTSTITSDIKNQTNKSETGSDNITLVTNNKFKLITDTENENVPNNKLIDKNCNENEPSNKKDSNYFILQSNTNTKPIDIRNKNSDAFKPFNLVIKESDLGGIDNQFKAQNDSSPNQISLSLNDSTEITNNIDNNDINNKNMIKSNSMVVEQQTDILQSPGHYLTNSIKINNSSAKNTETNNLTSPCSSVPTHYGSYSGIYKRLMRSVSNSLISSTTTVPNSNITDTNSTSVAETECSAIEKARKLSISGVSSHSFSNGLSTNTKELDTKNQPWLCEKCVENNCYPKYKIGMCVIFSLPVTKSLSTSTPPSSPLSSSCSPTTQQMPSKQFQKQQSYDPLVLFPSSPSLPSSPTSNDKYLSLNKNQQSNNSSYNCIINNNSNNNNNKNNNNNTNENFYEFFFSHLPLIEYQIKKLKEKLIKNMPLYFNPPQTHLSHRSSISNSSQIASNPSSQSKHHQQQQQLYQNQYRHLSFAQRMLLDFEDYENSFILLYSSPRLKNPAWLTIINNKKLVQVQQTSNNSSINIINSNSKMLSHKSPNEGFDYQQSFNKQLSNNSNTNDICDNLIKEFIYFNEINSKLNNQNNNHHHNSNNNSNNINYFGTYFKLEQGRKLLNSFRNSINSNILTNSHNNKINENSISNNVLGVHEEQSFSFLSTLLSVILKYHLSWVFTVLPSNEFYLDNCSTSNLNSLRKQRAHWTSILEKTNPYNPLWAQLGDLHGAVNQPLKLVRTVVVGKNRELVERLLFLLSYFLRCGNSSHFDIIQENFDFDKLPNQNSPTGSSSASSLQSSSPNSSVSASSNSNCNTKLNNNANNNDLKTNNFKMNNQINGDDDNNLNKPEDTYVLDKNSKLGNLHVDTTNSREVNIFELSIDPFSQFTAILASATAKNSNQASHYYEQTNLKQHKLQRPNNLTNEELSCISSVSSSSSMTSPSCSISSSPLFTNKNKKSLIIPSTSSTSANLSSIPNSQTAAAAATTTTASVAAASSFNCKNQLNSSSNYGFRKQRKLSSNSIGENCTAQELPLIGCELKPNYSKSLRMQDNFGYSLLASYCDEFVFEFVLHGTSDRSFLNNLHEKLLFSKQNSILDCPIEESIYIVVDADEFEVKVFSSESPIPIKEKSIYLVDSLIQSVLNMVKLFKKSELVLLHLEDKLQELYNKSITLNQLKSQSNQIDDRTLISLLELNDAADLEFLTKIFEATELSNFF